jgi:hypothetical protein
MSTDLDLDELQTKWDILGRFQSHGPSRAVAERAWDAWLNASPGERDALDDRIRAAATYANHLFQTNAWYRDELARRGMALRAQWQAQEIDPDDEEAWAREEAAEAEEERITRLEDEGAYGRTVRHTPDHARYIYIRFGKCPRTATRTSASPRRTPKTAPTRGGSRRAASGGRTGSACSGPTTIRITLGTSS